MACTNSYLITTTAQQVERKWLANRLNLCLSTVFAEIWMSFDGNQEQLCKINNQHFSSAEEQG